MIYIVLALYLLGILKEGVEGAMLASDVPLWLRIATALFWPAFAVILLGAFLLDCVQEGYEAAFKRHRKERR